MNGAMRLLPMYAFMT